jgi:hypothetical protein
MAGETGINSLKRKKDSSIHHRFQTGLAKKK